MVIAEEPNKTLYYSLRDELIAEALVFSRKITVFAMLEELNDLQATFCYSQQELSLAKDDKLIVVSHHIVNKIQEFINDMGEYGVDEDKLSSFLDLIDRFQLSIKLVSSGISMINEHNEARNHVICNN